MSAAPRVEVVDAAAGLAALRDAWERLWREDPLADLFASYEWFTTWWKHFGQGGAGGVLAVHLGPDLVGIPGRSWRLHVLVVRGADGEPEAILPLVAITGKLKGVGARLLSTPLNGQAPRTGLLAPRFGGDTAAALCDAICGAGGWDAVLLDGLAADQRAAALAAGLASRGLIPAGRAEWPSAYLRFNGTFEEFVAGGARLHFRRSLVKAHNGLAKLGAVSVERYAEPANLATGIALFMDVDGASWKAQSGESVGRVPALQAYYTDLCHTLGAAGRVEIWVLRVGDTPAAAFICPNDGRARYTLKASYREMPGQNRSPSLVLLHGIVRQTWGEAQGIDFVGKVAFLDRWANEDRQFSSAVFLRSRLLQRRIRVSEQLGRVAEALREAARRVRGRLGRSPAEAGTGEPR